jgi:hypothetical protein
MIFRRRVISSTYKNSETYYTQKLRYNHQEV